MLGEISSSGGATLYKNPSNQTVEEKNISRNPRLMYLSNFEKIKIIPGT